MAIKGVKAVDLKLNGLFPRQVASRRAPGRLIPNSAVESDVMSEEQTFRSQDNGFPPLSMVPFSLLCLTRLSR
jgi:hypothetical protein